MSTPEEAVKRGKEFLGCSFRELPLNEGNSQAPSPQPPWQEFTTNLWDLNHQLPGRYELKKGEGSLRVDYLLDSTHFPGKYHFFHQIEITEAKGKEITHHVIFGQDVDPEREAIETANAWVDPKHLDDLFHKANFVYPVILAGNFDLPDESREDLKLLANDQATKEDVRVVLKDILQLAEMGVLLRSRKRKS